MTCNNFVKPNNLRKIKLFCFKKIKLESKSNHIKTGLFNWIEHHNY